ncbi:MAG: DUF1292 domain-containing protein [Bacilli bacterium]|nr:DUF1292 domain-containing protein [Bacilli bacterium]
MQIIEDEKITVEINGKATECDLLFTFTSEDTGKGYVGYTDNTFTKDGRKNIYFSSYDPLFGTGKLEEVTDLNEIEMVKEVLEEIDGGVNNG